MYKAAWPCAAMLSRSAAEKGVDQVTFDAGGGEQALAAAVAPPAGVGELLIAMVFNGWPAKRLRKCSLSPMPRRPAGDVETTVGRFRLRSPRRRAPQGRHPGSVGTSRAQLPPPSARVRWRWRWRQRALTVPASRSGSAPFRSASQRWRLWKTTPYYCQPVQPGTQQRHRLHVGRGKRARAADEGGDADP